ncbi:hypothetical protein JG687_00008114, partial [Phytophthora cactorum]
SRALYRAGLRGTTRRGAHHETQRQQAQAKDKTALKIAANEALFGQTGGSADEPWALGLSSTSSTSGGGSGSGGLWGSADATWFGASPAQTVTATENVFTRSGNHNPARSGRSVGNSVRKATGGGDSLPLASADAPSMGNYDRDAHLRMPMAQRITGHPQVSQVAATSTISHHLPHRMKNAPPTNTTGNSNNSSSTVPYFHHFLDRSNNSSSSSSTNSLPFNQTSSFADSVPVSTGKRPRPSSSNSFLTPLGFLSPLFETDHPLPDFSTNWGFNSRNVSRSSNSTSNAPMSTSATMTTTSHSISNVTTTSNLAGIGSGFSSPNGASMFAGVDSFLPDYDSTLYSLWNAPGGGSVMGYETENDAAQGQQQQVQPPLYMTSDDELKMDYPQLPEFNQDLDSYLNDAMDSGASPTTPLGTSNSVMKMDHLVTTDRRTGAGNPTIEPKRAVMPSLGSYHSGQSLLILTPTSTTSATLVVSTGTAASTTPTTIVTSTSTTSAVGSAKSAKRPRSRQCEFPGCPNRARSHQKCKKHGGAHQCVFEGCTKNSQSRGLCIAHGGGSRCKREGCVRAAQSKGLCKSHGGGEYCAVEGCNKKAHLKHLCRTHGGGVRCKFDKCSKWAQRKGWCMAHAKEFVAT